ncbi:TPA: hypothetical protein BOS_13077 [Bos taurus]|nr:TPA: hypothetical protein BOS_13077 [Bos taurus]
MLEYLAGQFQLRSTRGREETASAGSIRGFAALGPSSSLNCSSASARQMEGGSCLRVAGNRPASSHVVQFDLQPTFLAPREGKLRPVGSGSAGASGHRTTGQRRFGASGPGTRPVGRLGPTDGEKRVRGCVGPRSRREVRAEPVRVHCVQRRHGSCHVRSILDRAVLEAEFRLSRTDAGGPPPRLYCDEIRVSVTPLLLFLIRKRRRDYVPRAAIWDSCARAASGSVSWELFDAAVWDLHKSLIRRAAHARWPNPSRPARLAFVVPGRRGRVADWWTERPPEDSRPGQRKRRSYGAGGVRRKAECGRRRRPPQRCGPRPSPQVRKL